jgi:hypothetical protein
MIIIEQEREKLRKTARKNHDQEMNNWNQHLANKCNLDSKLVARTTKRFLVRIGVYQIIRTSICGGDCCCIAGKRGLYRTVYNQLFRGQIYHVSDKMGHESIGIRMNPECVLARPLFHTEPSREKHSLAVQCWRTLSKFVVYHGEFIYLDRRPLWYLDQATNFRPLNNWNNRNFFDHIIKARRGCDYDESICLILPWFDRRDRMIFWKYSSRSHSMSLGKRILLRLKGLFTVSANKKNVNSQLTCVELIIYIVQYL